jgi:hypothetical protein
MITKISLDGIINNGTSTLLGAGSLFTTGRVIYVDSVGGSDGNNGLDPDFPVATIGQAQTLANASKGDIVVIKPGYTETRTAVLTLSKAGVSYVGLGSGSLKPTITVNGAVDGISVTGANITIANIHFAAPETDDATAMINVAAAGVKLIDISGIGSQTSKNFTDGITATAAANDLVIDGYQLYNTVVDMVSAISLEGASARTVIKNCKIQGTFSTAVLMDEATSTLALIENNLFKNTKAATAVVTFTTGNSTGVMRFNHLSGRHTTIASNLVAGTGMDFFENRVVEEAALNGAVLPAADSD